MEIIPVIENETRRNGAPAGFSKPKLGIVLI
jgi:hypothetical protein